MYYLFLPGLYFNILETEKILEFSAKYSWRAWHVIPAQEVKIFCETGSVNVWNKTYSRNELKKHHRQSQRKST